MGNWNIALDYVLANEGKSYVADPADRGVCSKLGITRATLSGWRGNACSCDDVAKLTLDEVSAIYKTAYWDGMKLDAVGPQATATALFDMAVLNGIRESARLMQQCLGLLTDGIVGPVTIAAINKQSSSFIVPLFAQMAQLRFLALVRQDSSQARFLPNWLHRSTKLMILAV